MFKRNEYVSEYATASVNRDKDLTDERASLFVSFAGQGGYYIPYTRWYKLSPDRAVTTISASLLLSGIEIIKQSVRLKGRCYH